MAYSYDTWWSPNTNGHGYGKSGICIHHAATTNFDNIGATFQNMSTATSAHLGVAPGRVCRYLADDCNAWACGNTWANDNLISIELVNSGGADDGWPVAEETITTAVELMAALCREHGWRHLEVGENLFGHKDFYNTFCPGVLYERLGEMAGRVNALLESGAESEDDVSAQDVWQYDYEGTAPGGNVYNAVIYGMRQLLDTSAGAAQDETGQHVDTGATPLERIPYIEGMLKQLCSTDAAGAEAETGEHVNTGANMAVRLAYMEAEQKRQARLLDAIAKAVGVDGEPGDKAA